MKVLRRGRGGVDVKASPLWFWRLRGFWVAVAHMRHVDPLPGFSACALDQLVALVHHDVRHLTTVLVETLQRARNAI